MFGIVRHINIVRLFSMKEKTFYKKGESVAYVRIISYLCTRNREHI